MLTAGRGAPLRRYIHPDPRRRAQHARRGVGCVVGQAVVAFLLGDGGRIAQLVPLHRRCQSTWCTHHWMCTLCFITVGRARTGGEGSGLLVWRWVSGRRVGDAERGARGGGRRGDVEEGKGDDEKAVGNRCSAFAARGRQACSSSPATSDTSIAASGEPENAIGMSCVWRNRILCSNAYD